MTGVQTCALPISPVQEKDQLYVLLREAITACDQWCTSISISLRRITETQEVFSRIGLFDDYADKLVANEEHKKQFAVFDNTIDALYEACKPEILGRRAEFPLAAVIHYLREVIEGKADRGNLDTAKRRISQLLDESIVAQSDKIEPLQQAAETPAFAIKSWRQIDLSKLNVEKLRQEFTQAPHKNIEIADLRAFISGKLEQLMRRNVTRVSFAEKLREIIDRYNAGNATNENYFEDLVAFVEQLREEELRAAREGLSEEELELFDLLKKDHLTKEEEQKVKLAAKNLLRRLRQERPTILINDWHRDTQTRAQVLTAIKKSLDESLPVSYGREVYSQKCDIVFGHFLSLAQQGDARASA